MFCAFCKEFDEERTDQSRIIWESPDFVLLPTIGCLRLGYCLFMPMDHVISFAQLPSAALTQTELVLEQHRTALRSVFGATIVAEHGPASYTDRGASCCDHAHLHLIPVQDHLREVRRRRHQDPGGGAPHPNR